MGVDFIVKNLEIDEDLLPADVLENLKIYMEEVKAKKAAFPEEEKSIPVAESTPEKEEKISEVPPEKEIRVTYNKQMTRNSRNKFIFHIGNIILNCKESLPSRQF